MLPESAATMSVYDDGAMMGTNVFEMTRSFHKQPFKLREHLQRLFRSAEQTHTHLPYTLDQLEAAHAELLDANRDAFADTDEYRTLITASRGPLPLYPHLTPRPWVMMTVYPLRWVLRGKAEWYQTGVQTKLLYVEPYWPSVKHHCRLSFRAAEHATAPALPIMTTRDDVVTEATGANVVIVRDGACTSPVFQCLDGISARTVRDLATAEGVDFRYGTFTGAALRHADEVFLTCTPFCILPVASVDGRDKGPVGPVTRRLMEAWAQAVDCDYVAQAATWDAEG